MKALFTAAALASLLAAGAASAQTPAPAPASGATNSHMTTSKMPAGHMTSSAGRTTQTKEDRMMIKNCMAMPKDKMMQDAECQDYMKNHPDWMKAKK